MHTFAHHHHRETDETPADETRGWVMNLGCRYDLLVWFFDTFLFRGTLLKLRLRTADLAQLQGGEAVLDVGCGTGALALEAYKRVGTTGCVCVASTLVQNKLPVPVLKPGEQASPSTSRLG